MRARRHEILFENGIKLMRKGEYRDAVTAFTRATAAAPGGLSDRKGGQYAIYLAQALQAAGRKKEAVGLLKRCESHPVRARRHTRHAFSGPAIPPCCRRRPSLTVCFRP